MGALTQKTTIMKHTEIINGYTYEVYTTERPSTRGSMAMVAVSYAICPPKNKSGMQFISMMGRKGTLLHRVDANKMSKNLPLTAFADGMQKWMDLDKSTFPSREPFVPGTLIFDSYKGERYLFTETDGEHFIYCTNEEGAITSARKTEMPHDVYNMVDANCEVSLLNEEDLKRVSFQIENFILDQRSAQQQEHAENQEKQNAIRLEAEKRVNKPLGAVALIVAELREDDSDYHSDYHSYKTTRKIPLAWSNSTREDFSEMRRAIQCSNLSFLQDKVDVDQEKREKRTGGWTEYYIGNKYDGWVIRKVKSENYAGFFEDSEYPTIVWEGGLSAPSVDKINIVAAGDLSIVDYSEKSFVLVGESRPYYDRIKSIGAVWSKFYLTHPQTGAKFKGWIFSKKKLEQVEQFLQTLQSEGAQTV